MNNLREDLDRRAAGFTPDRAAFQRVLDRAAFRRVRRRITAAVTAFAISSAAFTGLWAATHGSDSVPVATPTPSEIVKAAGLRVGLTVHLPRGVGDIVATHFVDRYGVYAATQGSLYGIEPLSGRVKRTANPGWDPEAVSLADYGEGTIVAAWGTRAAWFGNGAQGPVLNLATRVVGAVMDGDAGLWVTEWTGRHWALVRIDPDTGETIGTRVRIGQGRHSIVEAEGYVFAAGPLGGEGPSMVRADPRTGAADEVFASSSGGLAAVGAEVWGVDGDVWCVDAVTLESCGDIQVPRATSIAADGDRIWVLSATGSKNPSTYIPDPAQPATVTLLDGRSGAVLAGPIPLPDVTPGYISAANGHAWVGFYGSGLVLRVDTCADLDCTSARVHERIARIQQRIALLDTDLQTELPSLYQLRAVMRRSPKPAIHRQILAGEVQIAKIEHNREELAHLLDKIVSGAR